MRLVEYIIGAIYNICILKFWWLIYACNENKVNFNNFCCIITTVLASRLTEHKGISDRGTNNPVQPQRCKQKIMTVTETLHEFERLAMQWIATCVASRSMTGPGNTSIHREQGLISGNQSLRTIWESARKEGLQKVNVIANYEWQSLGNGEKGVKSISFTTNFESSKIQTKKFTIVIKSFIAPVKGNVGITPCMMMWPDNDYLYKQLIGLADTVDKQASEDPKNDRKDGKYRLFSRQSFTIKIKNGRIINYHPSVIETDFGVENAPLGIILHPPGGLWSQNVNMSNQVINFSWEVAGAPASEAEIFFRMACGPSRPIYIWHRVNGSIFVEKDTTFLKAHLEGSSFPSHRIWVNELERKEEYKRQGYFGLLWWPDPKNPLRVR